MIFQMKTIGLIGGMSWESSALYYRLINEETKRRLGGHHNARSLMVTFDFAEVERLQHCGDWVRLAALLVKAALDLERGGADFIVLCTNTMHKLADSVSNAVRIPLLHIVDATARVIDKSRQKRVGLHTSIDRRPLFKQDMGLDVVKNNGIPSFQQFRIGDAPLERR
jgi:aspartate racemase